MNDNFAALILASGKGTRMNSGEGSPIPKTLFELDGKPMIDHIYELLNSSGFKNIFVMVGYKHELIRSHLGDKVQYIFQEELNGTGHSLQVAEPNLRSFEKIFIINGDTPFFSAETVEDMINVDADIVLASSIVENPTGYGRIIRKVENEVEEIKEEKDADEEEKKINEVNAGCYAFKTHWLEEALEKLTLSPSGEYYITELPRIANQMGLKVHAYVLKDNKEAFGINTREELEKAHELIR